jgi:hypothetical protein
MNALIIKKTNDTPGIFFDPSTNTFEITHRSLPENANGFYEPVFKWLSEFICEPTPVVHFVFALEYFNTASAKQIAKILLYLDKLSQKCDVTIFWKFKKDDSDMQAAGLRYAKLLNVKFLVQEI